LIFLLNIFSKNLYLPDLKPKYFEYLYSFLSANNIIILDKDDFILKLIEKNWISYDALAQFLIDSFFITSAEFTSYRERIIAEYIAFKRFYSLLVSELKNPK